eukprot:1519199-Pleurochrysis_carterae.AAC.1
MGWSVYLAHMPGEAENLFGESVKVVFTSGQKVYCKPPFVSAAKGEVPTEAQVGLVLGILVGEERCNKRGAGEKSGFQLRRFVA